MKRFLQCVLTLAVLWCYMPLYSQVTFQKFYAAYDFDYRQRIELASNGDYIIGICRYSLTETGAVEILRLNQFGDTIWTNTYSSADFEFMEDITATQENGCAFVATVHYDTANHDEDLVVGKIDSLGILEWSTVIDVYGWDKGCGIVETSDGGFFISGLSTHTNPFALKLNSVGGVQWVRKFADTLALYHFDGNAVECYNGEYAFVYSTIKSDSQTVATVVTRLDAIGNILWHTEYLAGNYFSSISLDEMSNGDLIISARSDFPGWPTYCYSLCRIDESGQVVWSKIAQVSVNYSYAPLDVAVNANDELLVCGYYTFTNSNDRNGYVARFSSSGYHLSSKTYEDDQLTLFADITPTPDGGYAAVGRIDTGGWQCYLVKADAQGNAGCETEWYLPYVGSQTVVSVPVQHSIDTAFVVSQWSTVPKYRFRRTYDMCPVAVEEIDSGLTASVFYFPQHQLLNVNSESGSTCCIYDITGKLVKRELINTSTQEIYCSDLACGVYTYVIFDSNSTQIAGKFVKE